MASRPDPGGRSRFAKLGMAINDVLTQAYRDILEMDVPPSLVFNKVKSSSIYKRLRSDQELLLIDAKHSGYKKFDITLMYTLLRNICTTIPLPTNGWGKNDMPSIGEITVGDDIERIRLIRNSVFGHVYSASTSQKTFDDSWTVILDVCQRLQIYTGKNYMHGLQNIERQALEEEYEEAFIEKLRVDYENNKELRKIVSTLVSDVQEMKAGLNLNKNCYQPRNFDTQDDLKMEKDGAVSLKKAIIANWKIENETFVPTFATSVVEEKLQNQNFVIVVGNSGSGKTAMIQHIALKYQELGWDVIPIDEVREIKGICLKSFSQRLFILNDPIGKEKLDEISYNSWECLEKTLEICLEKSKMLVSCRRCVIKDNALQGLLKEESNIVEIDSGNNVLTDEEKIQIIKQYVKEENISKEDIDEIIKTDTYFPLLCKLLSSDRHYLGDVISLFKRPFELVKKEIKSYKEKSKEKYCALVLLSMFNSIDGDEIRYSESFKKRFYEIVEACDLPSNLQITSVKKNLKLLEGSFVKCIGSSFTFIHDFVMEVTTVAFGTDFPIQTIKYADSDFLRKRVKIREKNETPDPLSIYLDPIYIGDLIERFFNDINSDSIFDVVLNPCLRSEIVIEIFIEKMKNLDNLSMFYSEKTVSIEKYIYNEEAMNERHLSRIRLISLEEKMTPISMLITYCHDEISSFCLNNTDSKILLDHFLLPSVCANGSLELFDLLNEKNKILWIDRAWGVLYYPIHIASAFHNVDIVERLLQLGADPNTLSAKKSNPLILASSSDAHNFEVNQQGGIRRNQTIECLINYGTKVNLCQQDGYSPLHFCIFDKVPQNTIELLISYGADINLCSNSGESLLHSACASGHDTMAQFLLDKGIDIDICDKNGNSPLWYACLNEHESTVIFLLAKGAKIDLKNDEGYTAFNLACEKEFNNIVICLLEWGANINACNSKGASPLWRACFFGNDSIVYFLVQNDAKVNLCCNDGFSPLFISCEKGFENKVKILLNSGADVNLCDNRCLSPIGRASYDGRNNIIQLLLDKGADLNLCCIDGESPLYFACDKGHDSTVKLLLQNGADVNLCKFGIFSPIYVACWSGNNSIVKILLENGVDINAYDKYGCTPLVRACKKGHKAVVKMLMEHGADINLRDENGKTAVDIAINLNQENIVDLMLEINSRRISP